MNSPLVSVIICNYNYEKYLEKSIKSVFAQTYANYEILVVDDGSTDRSREIIIHYAKLYPDKLIPIFKANGGQASAFNFGFEKSKGEIISFLDSDDCWMPEKLQKVVDAFEKEDYALVQHQHYIIDEKDIVSERIWPSFTHCSDVFSRYFIEHTTDYFTSTSGISCLKKHLENIFPLDESWKICADVPLTRPLPILGYVRTLDTPLGYYRVHGYNTWMNSPAQAQWIENHIRFCHFLNDKLAKFGIRKRLNFRNSIGYKAWRIKNRKDGVLKLCLYLFDLGLTMVVIFFRIKFSNLMFRLNKFIGLRRRRI